MGEISVIVPTWLCARHALGAINSFHKFYPEIPVYIVDDESTGEDVSTWQKLYASKEFRPEIILDQDSSKLIGLPNTCYIKRKHHGYETEGHGRAVTYAMQFIHTKWVIHLSSDVRIVKDGLIEQLFDGLEDMWGAIGERANAPEGYVNLGKWLMAFRGDLYHELGADFMPDMSVPVDAGTPFTTDLMKRGYVIVEKNLHDYCTHLRFTGNVAEWEALY